MKRGNFIRELVKKGCYLKRHGKKHDIYVNPRNGKQSPITRYPEIKESLCRLIRKQLGVEQAQNAKERLTSSYSRLSTLVLRVAEYQPIAPNTVLNLLLQAIDQAQAIANASQTSIAEIKRNWD